MKAPRPAVACCLPTTSQWPCVAANGCTAHETGCERREVDWQGFAADGTGTSDQLLDPRLCLGRGPAEASGCSAAAGVASPQGVQPRRSRQDLVASARPRCAAAVGTE